MYNTKLELMKQKTRILLLLLLALLPAMHAGAQQQKVTLSVKNAPVSQVLMAINRQTGLNFVYSNSQLQGLAPVTIAVEQLPVSDVLTQVLGTAYTFKVENNSIVIQRSTPPQPAAQQGRPHIVGTVTDIDGNPLPGVTITFRGSKFGTQTSADGTYYLPTRDVKKGDLVFTFIGMKEHVVSYKGQALINVVMEEDQNLIDDVIVTGYGTYKRGEFVGAVNQVRADDIKIAAETTIDQMLQGVVPGMSVVNTTGKVGGTPKIRIRGTSTIMGNQEPLWVVDDVIQTNPNPIPNDASPLSSDFDQMLETAGNAISWLNPADIETITVLKDASATAIYGSQAANGVIVVTTKKAKQGSGLSVSYSGGLTVTQKPGYGLYDLMNSQESMKFQQQMWEDRNQYTYTIQDGEGYAGLLKQLQDKRITRQEFENEFRRMESRNTDWFDLLFRTPVSQQHNVSVSSSGTHLSSRLSLGYNTTEGEARGNDMRSFTASSNTTYRLSDKLIIDLAMNGTYRKTHNFAFGVSPYEFAMNTSRTLPCYNDDGTLAYLQKQGTSSHSYQGMMFYDYNILNERDNTGTETIGTTFQSSLSVKWNILKHLQLQGNASLSMADSKNKSWATEHSYYIANLRGYNYGQALPNSAEEQASILPFGGLLNYANNGTVNYHFRGAAVYNNTFAKKHNVTFNLGIETTSNKVDGDTQMRYGYLKYRGETFATVPFYTSLTPVPGMVAATTDLHEQMRQGTSIVNTISNQLSEYFTAVYSYDNRYVLNLNGRLDASNRFGQDENKRFNPSFSLGAKWRICEEHFMEWARSWYDMFDISFAYGWRGNAVTAVSPYLIARDRGLHTYFKDYVSAGSYFKQYYLEIVSLPYPGLGWEKTKDWNLGIDFSFLDGRLSATFNTYNKKSQVLASTDVPVEYGLASAYVDGTTMRNHGYELLVSVTPIRTKNWT